MILELEEVFSGARDSVEFDCVFDPEDMTDGSPVEHSPVSASGVVRGSAGVVTLTGSAEFSLSGLCDRCASPVTKQYSVPLEHVLSQHPEDEDSDLICAPGVKLDLDELVREDVILSIPMSFLCSEDCKGLCPVCGKDLNEGPCSCAKPVDPRLEALRALLDDAEEDN